MKEKILNFVNNHSIAATWAILWIIAMLIIIVSIGITSFITWLICLCFEWQFTFAKGIGVWLIMVLIGLFTRRNGNKE